MNKEIVHGKSLSNVSDALSEKKPKIAIVFIIDGCNAEALYVALDNGDMPELKSFMDLGHVKYNNCFTVFPSVTITCHASIVTGAYPGDHGIVGNEWFIRKQWADPKPGKKHKLCEVTREYVKYSWKRPLSDPGLANGLLTGGFFQLANSDMYTETKTIYEAYNSTIARQGSMSILEMVTRGVDDPEFIDLDDIPELSTGWLENLWNWIRSIFTGKRHLRNENKALDNSAFDDLVNILGKSEAERADLFVIWLPGMDGFSHKNGAVNQPEYFKDDSLGKIDEQFGKLRRKLEETGLLNDALVVITADHGQYDCSEDRQISSEMLYKRLKSDPAVSNGEILPLKANDEIDDDCKDASVVIVENGGACYIYIKSDNGWGEYPTKNRMDKFLNPLSTFNGTDRVFVRDPSQGEYKLWEGNSYKAVSSLSADYPFAEERINNLARTMRSPDIILSAQKPFYYAKKGMKGEHGNLHRENSHVPLIFINSNLGSNEVSDNVRVIDISPTIAESMGFLTQLKQVGSPKDNLIGKLSRILDALEHHLDSELYQQGARVLGRMKGTLRLDAIEEEWYYEELDMRENFERKLREYLDANIITQSEYDGLVSRYRNIVNESKYSSVTEWI
jgi:arylsulfatase A-like enzyme